MKTLRVMCNQFRIGFHDASQLDVLPALRARNKTSGMIVGQADNGKTDRRFVFGQRRADLQENKQQDFDFGVHVVG